MRDQPYGRKLQKGPFSSTLHNRAFADVFNYGQSEVDTGVSCFLRSAPVFLAATPLCVLCGIKALPEEFAE